MEIHYCNRNRLPPGLERGAIHHADPEDLLRQSQFFSINSPATAETHRFLDARRIALLPDGAVVVNTARGTVVDDDALIAALKSGKPAAAGLDVFAGHPDIPHAYYAIPTPFPAPQSAV